MEVEVEVDVDVVVDVNVDMDVKGDIGDRQTNTKKTEIHINYRSF